MICAIIISPDKELAEQLRKAVSELRHIGISRVLHQYPNEAKLPALLNAAVPDLIFLSARSVIDATDVAQRIGIQSPGTPIIAIHPTSDSATMLELLRVGVKDFLVPPFESRGLNDMLRRVESLIANRPASAPHNAPVFAFLPAKAGAGSTTIAVNTTLTLSRRPETKALLVDLDLNSGLVGFMLSLRPEFTVTDAAENAPDMDENVWSKIVSSVGNLDVLPAGTPKAGFRIDSSQVRRILEFGQRNYNAVCLDLSGMMERYSVDVLQYVKEIFLICTPEAPCMHLACAKLELLRKLELEDRIRIVVNRAPKDQRTITLVEMEKAFHQKVFMTLPNAYESIRMALVEGKPVKPTSELGIGIAKLAESMLPSGKAKIVELKAPEPKRSILDLLLPRKNAPARDELSPAMVKVHSS